MSSSRTNGTLSRDEIIDGLRELVSRLRATGHPARIQIVGGAAIALSIDEDRPPTADVDGPISPPIVVSAIAIDIATERNWPSDWVNDKAKIFLPSGFGSRGCEWQTIHDDGQVLVQVASPEMLLAMKLRAAEKRYLREAPDLTALLAACNITAAEEAEALLNDFFPTDALSDRVYELVTSIIDQAVPAPHPPTIPLLG